MKIAVIIPTLNEESGLTECLNSVRNAGGSPEVIVVDGGSSDGTSAIAREAGVRFLRSQPGRGFQMNRGAEETRADLLLFLHSDTLLPPDSLPALGRVFSDQHVRAAVFRSGFSAGHLLLRVYSFFTRSGLRWTMYGDQCIVCRSSFFQQIGRFPDWPLFEDVRFLEKASHRTKVRRLPMEVTTSARKFLENGVFRQQLSNFFYLISYHLGGRPEDLARRYYHQKRAVSCEDRARFFPGVTKSQFVDDGAGN